MREFMTEQLVKKKTTATDVLIKAGLILLTAASLLFFHLHTIVSIIFIVLVFLDIYMFRRLDVEYEYVYFDGDVDIAKIMNKQSRKDLFSCNIKEDMDIIAPTESPELQRYQDLKTLDYSTKNPGNKTYTMVTLYKGQKVKVIFEPNEKMLNGMRDTAPRKVIF